MSGYHHTLKWRLNEHGELELIYRPPAGATEQDYEVATRVARALPALTNPLDPPTVRLSAVSPEPSVWPHDKWFGTGDGESQPSS